MRCPRRFAVVSVAFVRRSWGAEARPRSQKPPPTTAPFVRAVSGLLASRFVSSLGHGRCIWLFISRAECDIRAFGRSAGVGDTFEAEPTHVCQLAARLPFVAFFFSLSLSPPARRGLGRPKIGAISIYSSTQKLFSCPKCKHPGCKRAMLRCIYSISSFGGYPGTGLASGLTQTERGRVSFHWHHISTKVALEAVCCSSLCQIFVTFLVYSKNAVWPNCLLIVGSFGKKNNTLWTFFLSRTVSSFILMSFFFCFSLVFQVIAK